MSTKIKIGADELILWLRKNQKAINIPNDEIQGVGRKIHDLIVNELGGEKIINNQPAHWANLIGDKNIEKLNLPKTSTQYEIESEKIGELYESLSLW
jgi:hypothetical protein